MTQFPEHFVWGAATSSYQIEGGADKDGRGRSIWDSFCRREGTVRHGDTGDIACDHYGRFREDVGLMQDLGLHAYRFSISWPRVLPLGTGKVNEPGLAFYDRLVDALLEHRIDPYVTLYHWDLPLELHWKGGWLNREVAQWFAEYTGVVVDRLGDRVSNWMTLNEPQVFIGLGYERGTHAPGLKLPLDEQLLAIHHCLLAHGRSVQVIRERARLTPKIACAMTGRLCYPVSQRNEDEQAAREATFACTGHEHWAYPWYTDPVCLGHYPEDWLRHYGSAVPRVEPGDLETMHQPLDWLGLNIYVGHPVKAGEQGPEQIGRTPGCARTGFDWTIDPKAMHYGPKFIGERYRLPMFITENGMSNVDWVQLDGAVDDPQRRDVLHRYLSDLQRGIRTGVDVRGYFHWSLLDNFEWAEGFCRRFGLIHVDFQTLARTPKRSAAFYRSVIAENALPAQID